MTSADRCSFWNGELVYKDGKKDKVDDISFDGEGLGLGEKENIGLSMNFKIRYYNVEPVTAPNKGGRRNIKPLSKVTVQKYVQKEGFPKGKSSALSVQNFTLISLQVSHLQP